MATATTADVLTGHDASINTVAQDLLGAEGVARAIDQVLLTSPDGWSTRVGVYGPWGCGKTSIMNLLRRRVEARNAVTITLSAWSATDEAGLIRQFYAALAARLKTERVRLPFAQRVKGGLPKVSWLGFLGGAVKIGAEELSPVPPVVMKVVSSALDELSKTVSPWVGISKKDLDAIAVLLGGRKVIVFIDDLDRADPRLVPKTLLALRELLDWPGFSFVLAFDQKIVAKALGEYSKAYGEDARGFLEKVIDVPFEVPVPDLVGKRRLLEAVFKECCPALPSSTFDVIVPLLPNEPRRIKLLARMIGALSPALSRHAADEVDWLGLVLFLMLKEANSAVAAWAQAKSQAGAQNWLIWAGDKREKEKQFEEMKGEIGSLVGEAGSDAEIGRLVDIANDLLVRWSYKRKDAILYWIELVYKPPTFTPLEVRSLIRRFDSEKCLPDIEAVLDQAAAVSSVPKGGVARDLGMMVISEYASALEKMADSRVASVQAEHLTSASTTLTFIEYLWSEQSPEDVRQQMQSGAVTSQFLGVFAEWIGWTRNDGEPELRVKEREIALVAVAKCFEPEMLFSETDPYFGHHHAIDRETATEKRNWQAAIRDMLTSKVVDLFCLKLRTDGGLLAGARGDDNLGAWLVENKESPLYNQPKQTQKLSDILAGSSSDGDEVKAIVAQNAILFLRQILVQTRDSSWGGGDHVVEIVKRCPALLGHAWNAVVAVRVPFRMLASIRKLRNDLIAAGLDQALLVAPSWLPGEASETDS